MIPPRIISILPSQRIASSSPFYGMSSTSMSISSASSLVQMISTSSSSSSTTTTTFPCCCFIRTAAAVMQALPSSTTTASPGGFAVQFFDRLFQQQQSPFGAPTIFMLTCFYLVVTNILYLARRSHLRKMSIQKLWKIRTTREPGVTLQLYFIILIAWQAFVLAFPIIEPLARSLGHVSFFYSYPNASGVGIIFEPRNVQNLKQSQRAKHQIRLDWHRFSVNIGNIGRDGFRHPPSIERNLPHIDMPKRGVKHWPWRRRWKSGGVTTE